MLAHNNQQHDDTETSDDSSTDSNLTVDPNDTADYTSEIDHLNSQLKKKLSFLKKKSKKSGKVSSPVTASAATTSTTTATATDVDGNSHQDFEGSLIDEKDEQVSDINPIIIKSTTSINNINHNNNLSSSELFSPISQSTAASSLIFERSVQDQFSNFQRRDSMTKLQRTQSSSSQCSPYHLNSECYVPTVLDATTAVVFDNEDLDKVEVIVPNSSVSNLLEQSCCNCLSSPPKSSMGFDSRRRSTSASKSISSNLRRPSSSNLLYMSMNPLKAIDYSERKTLNFTSFADLVTDENNNSAVDDQLPMIDSMSNFSSFSSPTSPNLKRTVSAKNIIDESESQILTSSQQQPNL